MCFKVSLGMHAEQCRVHSVAWHVVYQQVQDQGLGIQSLPVRREALMARHVVSYLLELVEHGDAGQIWPTGL